MFNNIENSQKGISLILTFFIMTIILAIVLGVAAILVSEIKIIRAMGNSVVAFYAADSGIEKTFYFDRKRIPSGGERGLCDICSVCTDCQSCTLSGGDCDPLTCTDCIISYYTEFDGKRYDIEATIVTDVETSETTIKSFGDYKETTRAIELIFVGPIGTPLDGPVISNGLVEPRSVPVGVTLDISATISDVDGVDTETTFAHIQSPDESDIDTVLLTLSGIDEYSGSWSGPIGTYYVDITACDTLGNCSEAENI